MRFFTSPGPKRAKVTDGGVAIPLMATSILTLARGSLAFSNFCWVASPRRSHERKVSCALGLSAMPQTPAGWTFMRGKDLDRAQRLRVRGNVCIECVVGQRLRHWTCDVRLRRQIGSRNHRERNFV